MNVSIHHMRKRFSRSLFILSVAFFTAGVHCASAEDAITLAIEGQTDYRIVRPETATPVDHYAAQELSGYLAQITGAEFAVADPEDVTAKHRCIFVGMSVPARDHLGEDVLEELAPREHVARSKGRHIFLYGQGPHGNLNAVMLLLREKLGWRWYSRFEHPVIPNTPTVELEPFEIVEGFDFTSRRIHLHRGMDWPYQMGFNQGFDGRVASIARRSDDPESAAEPLAHFVSGTPDRASGSHALKVYLPPAPEFGGQFSYATLLGRNDYFETNPEWFSYDARSGQRQWRRAQVCFSSPEMRRELTGNIRKVADTLPEGSIIPLIADDHPGSLCDCPGCRGLEAKYGTTGGPMMDYLFELCGALSRSHPTMKVRTLAYRRDQTQRPPQLPEGEMLPENLIVWFAPIHDNYFADWTHQNPEIQRTLADLRRWGEIAHEMHMYMYPNPFGSGTSLPVGNVRRFITNLRLAHEAGATGVYIDHAGQHQRAGFSELQTYLLAHLARDIDADADAVIAAFTDHMYGPAAGLMRQYMAELEEGREAMAELPGGVTYRSGARDTYTFPYLTTDNLHRWQGYFDRMTDHVAEASERIRANLARARRELDFATLWRWHDLNAAYPDAYADHAVVVARIEQANAAVDALPRTDDDHRVQNRTDWELETGKTMNRRMKSLTPGVLRDLRVLVEVGGEEAPLPARFADIDPDRIFTFVPQYPNNRPGRAIISDPDAPFGFAIPVENPELPFEFGFYQSDTRTHGARRRLELSEIEVGPYPLFELGEIELTPESIIWFSSRSWATKLEVGDRLWEPGEDTTWRAYVELRFDGPLYGGEVNEALLPAEDRRPYELQAWRRRESTNENLVLVGRVILMQISDDPFTE